MKNTIPFRERVRRTLISSAQIYQHIFVEYDYLILSADFRIRSYYIVSADQDNFLHLTGVHTTLSASEFFCKCIGGSLQQDDFDIPDKSTKGSVRRKISVLPSISEIFTTDCKIQESFHKNHIACSIATSTASFTIGFTNTIKIRPQTLLKGDEIKNEAYSSPQLILRKVRHENDVFTDIVTEKDDAIMENYAILQNLLAMNIREIIIRRIYIHEIIRFFTMHC